MNQIGHDLPREIYFSFLNVYHMLNAYIMIMYSHARLRSAEFFPRAQGSGAVRPARGSPLGNDSDNDADAALFHFHMRKSPGQTLTTSTPAAAPACVNRPPCTAHEVVVVLARAAYTAAGRPCRPVKRTQPNAAGTRPCLDRSYSVLGVDTGRPRDRFQ